MADLYVKNVSTKFDGFVTKEIFKEINDAIAYPILGAEYSDRVISGSWDGYIRLFKISVKMDPTGKKIWTRTFPSGVLGIVQEILAKHSVPHLIHDIRDRPVSHKRFKINPEFKPRPYQLKAVQSALVYTRGLIEAATGSGKSWMR